MIADTTIIWLVGISITGIFGLTALKMWYNLQKEDWIARKVRGLLTEVSKMKGQIKELSNAEVSPETVNIPDLSNITSLDQAAELFGIDPKDLNNPLIRPMLEKVFERFKSGKINESETENEGY
jgi:hypothetical protein